MPVFKSFPSGTTPQPLAWLLAASAVLLGLSAAAQAPPPPAPTFGTSLSAPGPGAEAGTEAGALKNLAFSGDVQVQDDNFSGGLANRSLDRDRLRYRVRLNLTSQLSTDFSAGIGLASGDVNDPVATSQDATGFYTRKPLDLNLACDPIALGLETAGLKNPETPGQGLLSLTSGLTPTNSIVTTTATDVVTVNGTAYPTGVTNISSAQFASKFGLFETLAKLNIETASPKWPLALTGDFVQNTEACANEGNIAPPPANTASVHYTQTTNVACDPHQRRGHWLEVQFGRGKQAGDWQFSYSHTRIESEAVLSNFDYNNLRQGTDVLEHVATASYQLHRNVQFSLTGLIGRPLNPAPNETWLRRIDTAVTYTF